MAYHKLGYHYEHLWQRSVKTLASCWPQMAST